MSTNVRLLVGVDVSKDMLDAYARPANLRQRFANDAAGIKPNLRRLGEAPSSPQTASSLNRPALIRRPRWAPLLAEGLPAVVVNARQVRDFAKGAGRLRQNRCDRCRGPGPLRRGGPGPPSVRWSPRTSLNSARFSMTGRGQLVRMLAGEKNHRHAAQGGSAKVPHGIERHIGYLQARIAGVGRPHGRHCPSIGCLPCQRRHSAIRRRHRTAGLADPVGPPARTGPGKPAKASRLWSAWPPTTTTAAPKTARHIRGGRSKVRMGLYQAAVAAIRHCPHMKAFYASLKARGKASKLALIAVARKILVLANALIRTMTPYQAPANSVC